MPWGRGQPTPRTIPRSHLPFSLQLCDLGNASVLGFPICDGTWSFIPSRSSGFWEGERGPQRGRSSVHGPRDRSPLPMPCHYLASTLTCDCGPPGFPPPLSTPSALVGFCPQGTRRGLRQDEGRPIGHSRSQLVLPSLQKKLPLMALSTTMAESFKELDPDSSMG